MKINGVKWLLALMMTVPVTVYAVPDTHSDLADVEDVFLNAFEKIKIDAAKANPETNEISNTKAPLSKPGAQPTRAVTPVKSVKSAAVTSTTAQHITSVTHLPTPVNNSLRIKPAVISAPLMPVSPPPAMPSASEQRIQSELADLRRQNAVLQSRLGSMNQQVTQLQEALGESKKLLSKDLNTLQSETLSPHAPPMQPAVSKAALSQRAVVPQAVKTAIELPSPQFSQPTPQPIPIPSTALPATDNAPAQEVAPQVIPGIDVPAATVNNTEPGQAEVQEAQPMHKSFLDNTGLLLIIGLVLIALGLFLLIWLLWPRSRRTSLPQEPAPLSSASEEDEYAHEAEFLAPMPEPPLVTESTSDTGLQDHEPMHETMKISELESFEQLVEEEREYLNQQGQESDHDDMDYSFMDSKDAIPVKLDLARAYLEMGDYQAVNDTLKTVLAEGSKAQQREAELLLEQARLAQDD